MSQLLSDFLRSRGFATLIAVDAMQTVMYAVRGDPVTVLLDIGLPGGSGLMSLRRMRENAKTASLPVFVITGSTEAALHRQLFALGAEAVLTKPVDLESLYTRIMGRLEGESLSA